MFKCGSKMSSVIRKFVPAVLCMGLAISGMTVSAEETAVGENIESVSDENTDAVTVEAETEESTEGQLSSGILPNGKSAYNLLLIGSDRRDESWNGNSDVMIVATINSETQKVVLTSFMRDLYAEIPGHGVHKLNYAFAVSGADKLEETLENNYDIEIDNYAIVDFNTMADIIDTIGGVEIELSNAEVEVMNNYIASMGAENDLMSSGGTYLLTGYQAVAYMRIRYVGNNDYERTQRQRNVLSTIFDSVQDMDAAAMTELADSVMGNIKHNISALGMIKLLAALPEINTYELVENRIPYDDLYHSQGEMLVPDFGATIERLHETMYN